MSHRPIRTGPELHDEARTAFIRRLDLAGCNASEALAAALLTDLTGRQIGLKDLRTPPPGTGAPPSQLPPDHPYHAAKARLVNHDTTQESQQ